MFADIFIHDFDRTENSDEIHAILGRALIIATRFDAMCQTAAIALDIKREAILTATMADDEYNAFVSKIATKYRSLKDHIKSIGLPEDTSVILHDARKARNAVAHDLTIGLIGCLDTKIDERKLIAEVSELMMDLAYGDIAISMTLLMFNGNALPGPEFRSSYMDRIRNWVVEK